MVTSILAIIAAVVGVIGIGVGAANSTSINNANIKSQEKINDKQIALARESYQQGTAKNQIEELQKAGYSEQQAKMLVAGSYSPSQQPVPALTAPVQSPSFDPAVLTQLIQGISQPLMQAANDSYGDPNGGVLGMFIADPVTEELSSHLHEVRYADICTPANFAKFANSADAPEWAKELVASDKWKKLSKSLLGQRAYNSWFQSNNSFATWEQQFDYQELVADLTSGQKIIQDYDISLKNIQEEQENIRTGILTEEQAQANWRTKMMELGFDEATLNLNSHKFLYALQNRAAVAKLQAQMAIDQRDYKLWNTPEARDMYIKRVCKEEGLKASLAMYQQAQLNDKMYLYETSPSFRSAHTTLSALDAMKISDSDLYRELYLQLSPAVQEEIESSTGDSDDILNSTNENVWLLARGKQIAGFIGTFKQWLSPGNSEPQKKPIGRSTTTKTKGPKGTTITMQESRDIFE